MKKKAKTIPIFIAVLVLGAILLFVFRRNPGNVKVGDFVEFGNYTWEILDIKGSDALVISERILEHRPYHSDYTTVTWAESDIREYLNGEFLTENFTQNDIRRIKTVKIETADNPWDFSGQGGNYKILGGEDTNDKVFLLNLDEVVKYMGDDKYDMLHQESMGKTETKLYDGMSNTRKAYDLHGHISTLRGDRSGMNWILRSPDSYTNNAAFVANNGDIRVDGYYVDDKRSGIHPAMWIKNADTLKKSVVECYDEDCNICAAGIYTDQPSPDAPYCLICDTGGECTQKIKHFRLYHQWKNTWGDVQDAEKLTEVKQLRDTYESEKSAFREQLEDATSLETGDGRVRITRVLSDSMYDRMLQYLNSDELSSVSYTTYDNMRLDMEADLLSEQTERIKEARAAVGRELEKANNSAITYEEALEEDSLEFLGALGIEAARERLKDEADDKSTEIFIDAIFGDNKLVGWIDETTTERPGTIDSYLQRTFLSE